MVGGDEALTALRHEVMGREFAAVLGVTDGSSDGLLLRVRGGRRRYSHQLVVAADEQRFGLDQSLGKRVPVAGMKLRLGITSGACA